MWKKLEWKNKWYKSKKSKLHQSWTTLKLSRQGWGCVFNFKYRDSKYIKVPWMEWRHIAFLSIQEEEGLLPLIKLITTNGPDLLVNVSEALGQCAKDKEVLQAVIDIDGVRLLWSLLKNPFEKVREIILSTVTNAKISSYLLLCSRVR